MGKWTRRILITLGVIVVVLAGAVYWLALESGTPSAQFALDIKEVRRLADSMPGERAREIHVEQVAAFSFPGTVVVAGDSWSGSPMPVFSYQLVFPASTTIIDTAMDEKMSKEMNTVAFDRAAYERMSKGIAAASLIVMTHEHEDHIGGLLAGNNIKALTATKLNVEQLANIPRYEPDYPKTAFVNYKPISYGRYLAIAPGVVLIRAAGHTPGAQIIYVKTKSGAEYLFLGDVAWHQRNIETVRERARLVTLMMKEDRDAVLSQLAALNALEKSDPAIHVVPGHDGEVVRALEDAGLLKKGFQ